MVDVFKFRVDLGVSLCEFCEECLTDRPQKKLTANLEKGKKESAFISNRHSVTRRHNVDRLQHMQKQCHHVRCLYSCKRLGGKDGANQENTQSYI